MSRKNRTRGRVSPEVAEAILEREATRLRSRLAYYKAENERLQLLLTFVQATAYIPHLADKHPDDDVLASYNISLTDAFQAISRIASDIGFSA